MSTADKSPITALHYAFAIRSDILNFKAFNDSLQLTFPRNKESDLLVCKAGEWSVGGELREKLFGFHQLGKEPSKAWDPVIEHQCLHPPN